MADQWHKVGTDEDFASGFRTVLVAGKKLVVGRLQGDLYAFDALCPHAGGPMELSEVEGTIVSCPLHAWRFDVRRDGAELHGYRPLPCRQVRVDDGSVYVTQEVNR